MKRILSVLIIALVMFAAAPAAFAQEAPTEAPAKPALVPAATDEAPAAAGDQAPEGPAATQPAKKPQKPDYRIFAVMIGVMVLLFWVTSRGKKKQQKKRQELLDSIKKGDKVTTIGGIVGTIVDVRETEVVLKVNDNNDIRMKFARWAVRGVGEAAKTTDPETEQK